MESVKHCYLLNNLEKISEIEKNVKTADECE